MGVVEDKVIKNHFASEYIYNKFKNTKTCGILEEDKANGLIKIAEPLGVIAGVIPTTNPTSTAIFKSLIALKTRNGIIFSPHPRAKKCTVETARIILEEAVKAGAPEDIIGWIENPTIFQTQYLMQHPQVVLCVQPFKNAEVSVRSHIWELMERFLKKNIAVVILAVNLADSLALADRLIRIRNGQIQEIYDQKDFSRLPEHTPWLHLYQKTYGNRSEDKK